MYCNVLYGMLKYCIQLYESKPNIKGQLGKFKKKIFKKLAFDQKGGSAKKPTYYFYFFIFLQTMNIASRLLDSWRTVKRNHISTILTIIKSLKL